MRFILLISTMFLSLPVAFMWHFASTLKWLFWSHVKSETIISSSSGYFFSCYNLPVVSWLNSRSRRSVRPHSPISIARYQVFVNRGYLVDRATRALVVRKEAARLLCEELRVRSVRSTEDPDPAGSIRLPEKLSTPSLAERALSSAVPRPMSSIFRLTRHNRRIESRPELAPAPLFSSDNRSY